MLGCGPIGILLIQSLKALGAEKVLATDVSDWGGHHLLKHRFFHLIISSKIFARKRRKTGLKERDRIAEMRNRDRRETLGHFFYPCPILAIDPRSTPSPRAAIRPETSWPWVTG